LKTPPVEEDGPPSAATLPAPQRPPEPSPPEDPERKWVWMDRWDPGTWQMPENPTPLVRVMAGIALVIVVVMTVYVPLRVLGFV
jgi:hypothetical protein